VRKGNRGYGAHWRWAHTQRTTGRARPAAVMKAVVPLLVIMSTTEILAAVPDRAELQKMAARFAPVELRADTSKLSPGDRKALTKLIDASHVIDDIFLQQLWSGNEKLYAELKRDQSPFGKTRLDYFWLNKGPWSDLDGHTAFLTDVPPRKLPGANFYPPDMTRGEFESWVKTLSPAEREQAEGFFTVIRRDANGKLKMVPYSVEYKPDLDAPVDFTIGPYETYNDELFGYKAAFEAYVNLRDEEETAKLKFFGNHLQEIENNLPIDAKYRNPKIGGQSPISVVN